MSDFSTLAKWDRRDIVFEDRYPKRNRKNKIENLGALEEPECMNKAEKLTNMLYDIEKILTDPKYENEGIIKNIPVEEFTLDYIKQTGLSTPLFFNDPPDCLGMKMPNPEEFTVDNVLEFVGANRKIEVVEVYEQHGRLMQMDEFIEYYKKAPEERSELLNVLSLEFSSTELAKLVSAPAFVAQIDWIDNVWPAELFTRQKNLLDKSTWARDHDFSTYPKVQRYCLMSVAKCFTDYHIDFGGTSVWYHILKGEKVFWLIEPTQENLKLYEEWILGGSGSNNTSFFGNIVNRCTRIHLKQGETLIIPSGWIHCVYTPVDSLVFGGNFLHSYAVPMQIRVSRSEDKIRIGSKYRFPHFKQIFWCYMAKVVKAATGRIYQKPPTEEAYTDFDMKTFPIEDEFEQKPNEIASSETERTQDDGTIKFECFFDNYGNAEDGSYTFNPIQQKFGEQPKKDFQPATKYNTEYLKSLSAFEINGFHSLLPFIKRMNLSRQPEVVEGVTRPNYLIMEFEALLKQITKMDLLNFYKEFELSQKRSLTNGFYERTITLPCTQSVTINIREPSKKKNAKRHSAGSSSVVDSKKVSKMITTKTPDQPILIDGLPRSTMAGINSTDIQMVPLGHKPIASAWRRSSNMAKPPPSVIPTFKKNLLMEDQSPNHVNEATNSSNSFVQDDPNSIEMLSPNNSQKKNKIRCTPRPRIIIKMTENHDNSPEFAHRSPLQPCPTTKPIQETTYNNRSYEDVSSKSSHNQWKERDNRYSNGRNTWRGDDNGRNTWRRDDNGRNNWRGDDNGRNTWRPNTSQRGNSFGTNQNWSNPRNNHYNQRNSNGYYPSGQDTLTFNTNRQQLNENADKPLYASSISCTSTEIGRPQSPDEMDIEIDQEETHKYQPPAQDPDQFIEQIPLPHQSMSTTVNELHHISQIMNNPAVNFNMNSIDDIPLPPSSPKGVQNASSTEKIEGSDDHRLDVDMNASHDPFTQVDELAQLGQMMFD